MAISAVFSRDPSSLLLLIVDYLHIQSVCDLVLFHAQCTARNSHFRLGDAEFSELS